MSTLAVPPSPPMNPPLPPVLLPPKTELVEPPNTEAVVVVWVVRPNALLEEDAELGVPPKTDPPVPPKTGVDD